MPLKNNKKIVILVGDGMADYPIKELGDRTPLEAAITPNMDYIAGKGVLGLAKTVPDGLPPGSDVANLSIFGYDPALCYTGRAPLEALNMGIELNADDVAFRCNLVDINGRIMEDFSADHIDTEFTKVVIGELQKEMNSGGIELYPGVSYRNILIWRNYPYSDIPATVPPHDIQTKQIDEYLPKGHGSEELISMMDRSREIIGRSAIIKKSRSIYKGNPTSTWLWGGGKKPAIDTLNARFGLRGYTISAVDLIHGIGMAAGLSSYFVEGATGYLDTNYSGKAEGLLKAIKDSDFVLLHVEAPDEAGHEGNLEHKLRAIEDFDKKIVGRVLDGMSAYSDYCVLVMPDHPTPISLRTHASDPVPFCIFGSGTISGFRGSVKGASFNEKPALATGNYIEQAHTLLEIMINGGI